VVGRFLFRNLITRAREGVEPKRVFYDVQKLKVRAERLIEAIEGISGARPGERLQIDVRGLVPLDQTVRVTGRRLAIAVTAAAALVAMGNTAAASRVANWVPISLGALGVILVVALIADLLRRR
jgi:ubiquinone biosynthesis protein